ncbi:hypothetical protein C2845_PM14G21280 [Panicum miliaceum]|uniref:Rhamnogalacturonan lyase domain-containing protein n=1 Tax=Panicum miliaceum TaxID=4540 RepID=A0A3L6PPX4_PANMI|nr:hypothetical protein C2845_PM14G21280 [Panicum miliaceum]
MGPPRAASPAGAAVDATAGVRVKVSDRYVEIKNGIFELTLSNPDGIVTGVRYNGVDNLMEILNKEDNRGYWDLVWNPPGQKTGIFDVIKGTEFRIIYHDENQAEVSFSRNWDPSLEGKAVPLNIDKRFIILRGSSGFYTYGIYEHKEGWPDFGLGETRVAFKLRKDKFHYMALADDRQRIMPMPDDRLPPRGLPLAYPEAVLLVDPINPDLRGEVDDKYHYSCEDQYNNVHGWMSFDPPIGFWQITPSDEFRTGGPLKQNLTSHVGPTMLAMFLSAHYAGDDLSPMFTNGEYWKKVHGPVFMYLNSSWDGSDPTMLWEDAKVQMMIEKESWPYSFALSDDFQKTEQRGCVSGRLLVRDRYIDDGDLYASGAYVGLALPGEAGSWQRECKGYQFWCRADVDGSFYIRNIVTGNYNLKVDENTYQPTTWQIKFNLDSVSPGSAYNFRVALASSARAELQVFFNDKDRGVPHFATGLIGRDNAIARHGIHGLYWLFNINVDSAWLVQGMNTIYLKQPRNQSPFQGLMYDYLRLEGPCGC